MFQEDSKINGLLAILQTNRALFLAILLIPITIILGIPTLEDDFYKRSDWETFTNNRDYGVYPPIVPLMAQSLNYSQKIVMMLLIVIWIPAILISYYTRNLLAGVIYSYFTIVPIYIFDGGMITQAIMHILLILNIINPLFIIPTTIIGYFTHREFIAIALLSIFVHLIVNGGYIKIISKVRRFGKYINFKI